MSLCDAALDDQEELIATIAHELAHEILLGGGLLTEDNPEHEPITDLLTVLLGMGVFPANTAVKDQTKTLGSSSLWSIQRRGYLPARMFGYAFALASWIRNDESPSWAWALQADAAHGLKAGLKYLRKADDCLVDRSGSLAGGGPRSEAEIAEWLDGVSDTKALFALWELSSRPELPIALRERIAARLSARHPHIRSAAVDLLATQPELPESVVRSIVSRLVDPAAEVRRAAAAAVVCLRVPSEFECENGLPVSENLGRMLDEDELRITVAAADALSRYGAPMQPLITRRLLSLLARSLARVNAEASVFSSARGGIAFSRSILHPPMPDAITAFVSALDKIGVDVEQASRENFGDSNPGRHEMIVAEMREYRKDQRRARLSQPET